MLAAGFGVPVAKLSDLLGRVGKQALCSRELVVYGRHRQWSGPMASTRMCEMRDPDIAGQRPPEPLVHLELLPQGL